MNDPKPIVCTLDSRGLADRGQRWKRLLQRAVIRRTERIDGYVFVLQDNDDVFGETSELVAAEMECCSWIGFEIRRTDALRLTMTADSDEGKRVIGKLVSAFEIGGQE